MDFLRNNPSNLDSREEIREAVREAGGDPMDTETQEETQFAWSLEHRSDIRPTPKLRAAETELIAQVAQDRYGEDVSDWDWPDIPNAPAWYDGK